MSNRMKRALVFSNFNRGIFGTHIEPHHIYVSHRIDLYARSRSKVARFSGEKKGTWKTVGETRSSVSKIFLFASLVWMVVAWTSRVWRGPMRRNARGFNWRVALIRWRDTRGNALVNYKSAAEILSREIELAGTVEKESKEEVGKVNKHSFLPSYENFIVWNLDLLTDL